MDVKERATTLIHRAEQTTKPSTLAQKMIDAFQITATPKVKTFVWLSHAFETCAHSHFHTDFDRTFLSYIHIHRSIFLFVETTLEKCHRNSFTLMFR